jgi:hypothetical protein
LLSQGKLFEFLQTILLCSAINDGILKQIALYASVIDSAFNGSTVLRRSRLKLPRVAPLIMSQSREVIPLVEIFEDGAENLRLFIGESNPFRRGR